MKTVYQYSRSDAAKQFTIMCRQWQANAAELHKKSKSNQKVQEMCQSLGEAMSTVEGWAQLSGTVMLVVAYQPSMFDDEEFGRGADFDPR